MPGDEVAVDQLRGAIHRPRACSNHRSSIRVRLYRWEDAPIDDEYLTEQAGRGLFDPRPICLVLSRTEISRLGSIFSESDGLSGTDRRPV